MKETKERHEKTMRQIKERNVKEIREMLRSLHLSDLPSMLPNIVSLHSLSFGTIHRKRSKRKEAVSKES